MQNYLNGRADVASPYEVLGVAQDAPGFVIQAAYRACLKQYHPDHRHGSDARARTQEVIDAYAILSDPAKRARLDQRLAGHERARARKEQENRTRSQASRGTPPPRRPTPPPRRASNGAAWLAPLGVAAVVTLSIFAVTRAEHSGPASAAAQEAMLAAGLTQVGSAGIASSASLIPVAASDTAPAAPPRMAAADRRELWSSEAPMEFANVESGAKRFLSSWASGGLKGARAISEQCHKDAAQDVQWNSLDFCASFDFAASIMDSSAGRVFTRAPDPYFKFQAEFQGDHYGDRAAAAYRRLEKIRTVANSIVAQELQRQTVLAAAQDSEPLETGPAPAVLRDGFDAAGALASNF